MMESEDQAKWDSLCRESQLIQDYLAENKDEINLAGLGCQSALEHAVRAGRSDISALILSNGGRITQPVILASWASMSIPIFQAMIDTGWDINYQGHWQDTLTLAMRVSPDDRRLELVKWLIAHGANPSIEQPLRSRLSEAALYSSTDVMLVLVEYGLKVEGSRALETAAKEGRVDMVLCLLDNGVDVNEFNDNFWTRLHEYEKGVGTALHAAAAHGKTDVVKMLLERGADPYIKDNNDRTALERAEAEGKEDIVILLKNHTSSV